MRSQRCLILVAALLFTSGCASTHQNAPASRAGRAGTAASGQAATSELDQARYVIGPEDLLHVSVWREEGLTRQVRVRPDGRISFPLVGDIQAAGLTAPQLEAELTRLLQAYVTAPAVSVIVDEVNSYKVYVLGEVERPGALPVRAPVTVLQALALAGGLKPFAAGDRMVLVRQLEGRTLRLRLSYSDLVLGRNGAVNLTLESGDTLVVP